jgi:hypothetical protein
LDNIQGWTMKTAAKPILAKSIHTTHEALIVELDGRTVAIPWTECSSRLAPAGDTERAIAELSPSGYGIHWPLLDEDLAVGPLITGHGFDPPSRGTS